MGKEYLDSSGGSWVVLGDGCEKIAEAISNEVMILNYAVNPFGNIPLVRFVEKLIDKIRGMNRGSIANSGSEANEKAFRIIRQVFRMKHDGKKYKTLYRNGNPLIDKSDIDHIPGGTGSRIIFSVF